MKEWAAVVRALESGALAMLVRKGGLRDGPEGVGIAPARFWLWPTRYHQEALLLRPNLHTCLGPMPNDDEPLVLRAWAETVVAFDLDREDQLPLIVPWQPLREAALRCRFRYRSPGAKVLLLRVYRAAEGCVVDPRDPRVAGCVSWAPVDRAPPPRQGEAVNEPAVQAVLEALRDGTAIGFGSRHGSPQGNASNDLDDADDKRGSE